MALKMDSKAHSAYGLKSEVPKPGAFRSLSVIVPVMNETTSLEQTVEIVMRDVGAWVAEILIVVCDRTTSEAMVVINKLAESLGDAIVVHHQRLPYLGGAMREAFELAKGSHTVMMASDLETDPNDLAKMVEESRKNPSAIITASRWRAGGGFSGYSPAKMIINLLKSRSSSDYSPTKLILNSVFQSFFSILYQVHLSDMTFGYRCYPTAVIQSIEWEELRHPFLFECLVKPLRLGVPVIEIASGWKARIEGESQNTFLRNFVYFRTGLRTRFRRRKSILKPGSKLPLIKAAAL